MNKFLLTLSAGIIIGILVAPAKGSETRKRLKDSLDDIKDSLDDAFKGADNMLKNAINTIAEGEINKETRAAAVH